MLLIQFVDPLARTAIDFQVSLSGLIDALMLHLKLLITWRCHRVIDRWNEAISMQSFNLAGYLNKNWALINFYSIKARVWCINSIRGGGGVGGSNERWQSDTNWRRRGEKKWVLPPCVFLYTFQEEDLLKSSRTWKMLCFNGRECKYLMDWSLYRGWPVPVQMSRVL